MSQPTALSFSIGQLFSESWQLLKQKWAFLLGLIATLMLVSFTLSGIYMTALSIDTTLGVIVYIGMLLACMVLGIGTIQIMVKVARGQTAQITELFSGSKYLAQYALGYLVYSLVVMLGTILLVIPGIIWGLKYMFTLFIIVDDGVSFSEAMARSAQMTQGIKWKLLLYILALYGLNLLGCIPLFLGLLITYPITLLSFPILYVTLKKQLNTKPTLKSAA